MKTTLEMPDAVFRKAKAQAAEEGIPLRQLVTEAVRERVDKKSSSGEKPWMKHVGKLKHLKKDLARINKIVEEEFGKIEPEDWA